MYLLWHRYLSPIFLFVLTAAHLGYYPTSLSNSTMYMRLLYFLEKKRKKLNKVDNKSGSVKLVNW